MIDLKPYKPKVFKIAKAMDMLNDYYKYRKHTTDELAKGIAAEVAFKIHKKLRPTFELFLDKNGDGGNDVLGYDVKYIPHNGKYLILYPEEIFKSEKYVAVRVNEDITSAEIIGEISASEFREKCFNKDFGYGLRAVVFLSDLNN